MIRSEPKPETKYVTLTDEILSLIAEDVLKLKNLKCGDKYPEEMVEAWIARKYVFNVKVSVIDPLRVGVETTEIDFSHVTISECQKFIASEQQKEHEYNEDSFEQLDRSIYGACIGKKQIRGCKYRACRYTITL
jgi:hypothetical protein